MEHKFTIYTLFLLALRGIGLEWLDEKNFMPQWQATNMVRVRVFGDVASHQEWVEQSGFEVSSGDEDPSRVLICTYDNQAEDPLVRLEGTITPMREAMTFVLRKEVKCVVLVTDGAGYAGSRKVPNTPSSATFVDVHGMGSLTSEVLANIAINAGAQVTVVQGNPLTQVEIRTAIIEALKQT